ncbi:MULTISPECIES: response regulator [unclassified Beijerinckia]|uniref:response regulator n=1 Tax=unclassified Beijerinckia TaxID=2638183 RepID=UPI00089AD0D0|nr:MULTISPECIES: response regulator [unclassified Beijerinckia]MDH7799543.1 CheY-like chemotaxis protein [Beijerinckia sp. GAS462]SEB46348.1 Response regulator receiver domain-containing protein [Beijerinckia sp. 28-YEA-48]
MILIAEDDALQRLNLEAVLVEAGFTVVATADGDEALGVLQTRSDILVLISDVQMPGSLNGIELMWVVRDRWPPVKIILTSGNAKRDGLPDDVVLFVKPYIERELLSKLRLLLA